LKLGRPKGRLQKLAVFFTPSATLSSTHSLPEPKVSGDDYLPSLVPQSANLLQAFNEDPVLGLVKPYLSASRLSKPVSAVSSLKEVSTTIRCGPRRLFRAAPAFLWRIRFIRFPNLAEKDAILALFDIEITQFAACNVSLDKIEMLLTSGSSEPIGVDLPMECQPGEQLTLIYKILPSSDLEKVLGNNDLNRVLTIILTSTVLVADSCLPVVKIKWKQALETPPSRPPSRSAPMSATVERSPHIRHDALTMTGEVAEIDPAASVANGVSFHITSPEEIVVGEIFRWEVLVVNRSEKVQRLALIPIPKRRLADVYPTIRRPGSAGSTGGKSNLATPVVEENMLYAIQKSSILEPTELVCLTPDVKIG
jgi:TRAPP trafficking subunit Trs65